MDSGQIIKTPIGENITDSDETQHLVPIPGEENDIPPDNVLPQLEIQPTAVPPVQKGEVKEQPRILLHGADEEEQENQEDEDEDEDEIQPIRPRQRRFEVNPVELSDTDDQPLALRRSKRNKPATEYWTLARKPRPIIEDSDFQDD